MMYDAIFKIVIFGDAGCGKTTLLKRYITNLFISDTKMTIGVDFETKTLNLGGLLVKLMIWDFGGEERFRFIFPNYISGAMGGILMYDITDYSSLSHAVDWLTVINQCDNSFPILLIGGKSDLDIIREVSHEEGLEIVEKMNLHAFYECSSKTGDNVDEIFRCLVKTMINIALI
jgi:small GTP-binding protein